MHCDYYNSTCKDKDGCVDDVEICHVDDHKYHCFVLWSLGANGTVNVSMKVKAGITIFFSYNQYFKIYMALSA